MIEKIKTNKGIKVIFDKLENISTCAVGVFVKTGSANEADDEEGISHVLEHMIFKGTPTRNYLQISEEIDYLGANINAYTTKEETVFYVNALTEFLDETVEILFDIVTNSTINSEELEKEKDVIIEEIKMYKDTPDDLVFELNYADCIKGRYSKPIIGTVESVKSFSSEMVKEYYKDRYTKDNLIIVVSGNFDKEKMKSKIDEYFSKLNDNKVDRKIDETFEFVPGEKKHNKDINQVNICVSYKGKKYESENRIYNDIIANIIGGSMSSRLFQEIREKKGLAYSVYTYNQYYKNGGVVSTYIGTNIENYKDSIDITLREFNKIRENGIVEFELQKAKNKYLSKLAFSMENPRSRMSILGNYYTRKTALLNIESLKEEIKNIKLEEINEYLKTQFLNPNITILGNV